MIDEPIEHIERLLTHHPELRSDLGFGPVPESDVNYVEAELEVRFPESFRAYLRKFAGGLMLGYEMSGIPTPRSRIPPPPDDLGLEDTDDSAIVSILDINNRMRKHYPSNQIYICNDGGDFSFFLDTAKMSKDGECPVIMYGPGADGVQIADSFLHFLEHLANRRSFRT